MVPVDVTVKSGNTRIFNYIVSTCILMVELMPLACWVIGSQNEEMELCSLRNR